MQSVKSTSNLLRKLKASIFIALACALSMGVKIDITSAAKVASPAPTSIDRYLLRLSQVAPPGQSYQYTYERSRPPQICSSLYLGSNKILVKTAALFSPSGMDGIHYLSENLFLFENSSLAYKRMVAGFAHCLTANGAAKSMLPIPFKSRQYGGESWAGYFWITSHSHKKIGTAPFLTIIVRKGAIVLWMLDTELKPFSAVRLQKLVDTALSDLPN
jgi:hypothetical protein